MSGTVNRHPINAEEINGPGAPLLLQAELLALAAGIAWLFNPADEAYRPTLIVPLEPRTATVPPQAKAPQRRNEAA
jgi:hypothetical protein